MSFEDSFGAYAREDLQEALRSIDLEKNPEDYAAVKARLARGLRTKPRVLYAPPTSMGSVSLVLTTFAAFASERVGWGENAMISRQWRGLARLNQAETYREHLRSETFPALRALPGFVSASVLSRPFGDGIEFLVVTQWRTLEDIARFSGPDLEAAVVPVEVAEMMIDYDRRVKHYEVAG
jgi:hypothetical protein